MKLFKYNYECFPIIYLVKQRLDEYTEAYNK